MVHSYPLVSNMVVGFHKILGKNGVYQIYNIALCLNVHFTKLVINTWIT